MSSICRCTCSYYVRRGCSPACLSVCVGRRRHSDAGVNADCRRSAAAPCPAIRARPSSAPLRPIRLGPAPPRSGRRCSCVRGGGTRHRKNTHDVDLTTHKQRRTDSDRANQPATQLHDVCLHLDLCSIHPARFNPHPGGVSLDMHDTPRTIPDNRHTVDGTDSLCPTDMCPMQRLCVLASLCR